MTEINTIRRYDIPTGGYAVFFTTIWESGDKKEIDVMEKILREKLKEKEGKE